MLFLPKQLTMKDFLNRLDEKLEAQALEEQREKSAQIAHTKQAVAFAERMSKMITEYEEPLRQRSFITKKEGIAPYISWSVNYKGNTYCLRIENTPSLSCGYMVALYENNEQKYHKYEAIIQQNGSDDIIRQMIETTIDKVV